jgi:glycosyltransferase involved in cell wall biosynthesis
LLANLRELGIACNLIIVGQKWSNSYYLEVEQEIKELFLEETVTVMPMVGQKQLVAFYQQSDICFFPSYYRTGFSRIPLEAMACGCIVFSYGNEGSDEIIQNKQNGFLVSPGDYREISLRILELIRSPRIVEKLTSNARKEVDDKFSIQEYVDSVEEILINAAEAHQANKQLIHGIGNSAHL